MAKAVLYNYGTITEISGGMFTRSKETQYPVSGGTAANSWYTVVNGGVIEEISGAPSPPVMALPKPSETSPV